MDVYNTRTVTLYRDSLRENIRYSEYKHTTQTIRIHLRFNLRMSKYDKYANKIIYKIVSWQYKNTLAKTRFELFQ